MTWDKRLYFPSEGSHAEDYFTLKNLTASARFEPANLGTKGQHATSRPLKPLYTSVTYPFTFMSWLHEVSFSGLHLAKVFLCRKITMALYGIETENETPLLITNVWFNVQNMNTYNTPFLFQWSSTMCSCNLFCLCRLPVWYLGAMWQ